MDRKVKLSYLNFIFFFFSLERLEDDILTYMSLLLYLSESKSYWTSDFSFVFGVGGPPPPPPRTAIFCDPVQTCYVVFSGWSPATWKNWTLLWFRSCKSLPCRARFTSTLAKVLGLLASPTPSCPLTSPSPVHSSLEQTTGLWTTCSTLVTFRGGQSVCVIPEHWLPTTKRISIFSGIVFYTCTLRTIRITYNTFDKSQLKRFRISLVT